MRISDWSSDVCSSDLLQSLTQIGCRPGKRHRAAKDIRLLLFRQMQPEHRRIQGPAAVFVEIDRGGTADVVVVAFERQRIEIVAFQDLDGITAKIADQAFEADRKSTRLNSSH